MYIYCEFDAEIRLIIGRALIDGEYGRGTWFRRGSDEALLSG